MHSFLCNVLYWSGWNSVVKVLLRHARLMNLVIVLLVFHLISFKGDNMHFGCLIVFHVDFHCDWCEVYELLSLLQSLTLQTPWLWQRIRRSAYRKICLVHFLAQSSGDLTVFWGSIVEADQSEYSDATCVYMRIMLSIQIAGKCQLWSTLPGAHFHLDCNRTNVLDNANSIGHLSWKPNNNRTFLSCSLEQHVLNGKFSAMTENNTQSNSSTVHTGLKSN